MRSETSRQQNRDHVSENRKLNKLRAQRYLGGTCVDCGTISKLEFSHNDPSLKSFHIYTKLTCDFDSILRPELDKCSLRCESCHLLYDGKNPEPVHGTLNMYRHKGCRCRLCKDAHAEAVRSLRAKNKVMKHDDISL